LSLIVTFNRKLEASCLCNADVAGKYEESVEHEIVSLDFTFLVMLTFPCFDKLGLGVLRDLGWHLVILHGGVLVKTQRNEILAHLIKHLFILVELSKLLPGNSQVLIGHLSLDGDVDRVLEHRTGFRKDDHWDFHGHLLLVILEVQNYRLLFNQCGKGLDVINTVID